MPLLLGISLIACLSSSAPQPAKPARMDGFWFSDKAQKADRAAREVSHPHSSGIQTHPEDHPWRGIHGKVFQVLAAVESSSPTFLLHAGQGSAGHGCLLADDTDAHRVEMPRLFCDLFQCLPVFIPLIPHVARLPCRFGQLSPEAFIFPRQPSDSLCSLWACALAAEKYDGAFAGQGVRGYFSYHGLHSEKSLAGDSFQPVSKPIPLGGQSSRNRPAPSQ